MKKWNFCPTVEELTDKPLLGWLTAVPQEQRGGSFFTTPATLSETKSLEFYQVENVATPASAVNLTADAQSCCEELFL